MFKNIVYAAVLVMPATEALCADWAQVSNMMTVEEA